MKRLYIFSILISMTIAITSCGIKPSQLKPADDSQVNTFPRDYPASK
ncbi:MAG: hypothetical protein NZ828_02455 [Alphaproteobacteria bacterium]|nr:hypothetical protein [Alphaproteobacteria bacterium]